MRVILANDPSLIRTVQGVTLYQWSEAAGVIVGQADCGNSADGGIVMVNDHGAWMRQGYAPHPPRLAVSGLTGLIYVAISGEDTPEPDAVTWEEYRPYVKPKPDLPPVVGPFPPHWIGGDCSRGAYVPGNCAWGANEAHPEDNRPVMDVGGFGVTPDPSRPVVCGWLHTPVTPDAVTAELERIKGKAHAIYIHWDDINDSPFDAARQIEAAGFLPVIGCNAVTRLDIYQAMLQVARSWRFTTGSTINIRTLADRNPEDISACAQAAVEELRAGRTVMTWVFGWEAQGDLSERWPSMARYLTEVAAAVPTPERFLGTPDPVPAEPMPPKTVESASFPLVAYVGLPATVAWWGSGLGDDVWPRFGSDATFTVSQQSDSRFVTRVTFADPGPATVRLTRLSTGAVLHEARYPISVKSAPPAPVSAWARLFRALAKAFGRKGK